MTTIQIEQLVKQYRGRQQPALDHVSLNIQSGMYGLLGKNGAGKSTLMKILTTLEKPTSGKVLVDGTPLKDARSIRRKIGYLPQQFGFYPTMKVIDAMTYLAILAEVPAREQKRRIERLLAAVHLTAQAKTKVKALSGGMLQRLGIAQALVNEPRVLIVDEPTAGLDPEERIRFRNLLADFANERLVLLSTHIVSDVEATTNRIGILDHGRLVFNGTTDELIDAAAGHVFVGDLPVAQLKQFKTQYQISEQTAHGQHIRVRFLARTPLATWQSVAPTLEEAYLYSQTQHHQALVKTVSSV